MRFMMGKDTQCLQLFVLMCVRVLTGHARHLGKWYPAGSPSSESTVSQSTVFPSPLSTYLQFVS